MKISVLLHTVSKDDFLTDKGIPSYFAHFLTQLPRWAELPNREFELVWVDGHWGKNMLHHKDLISNTPFCVKHVPIHPNHRYWYEKGYVFIAAAKNTGILYADGELCITFDDAEFMPDGLLSRYWDWYQRGVLLVALHKRWRKFNESEYVNDKRWQLVEEFPTYRDRTGNMCYAGTSFPLEDALRLNGFDELYDGRKSLEDSSFGERLARSKRQFAFDREGFVWILDHTSYGDYEINIGDHKPTQEDGFFAGATATVTNLIAIENYGLMQAMRELNDLEANRRPLSDKHLAIIQRETLKYRGFDPLAPEHKQNFDIFYKTPTFDLREERAKLRAGAWQWSS